MNIINKIKSLFIKIESILLITALITTVILSLTQIILRYFFQSGILWIDPFVRYLIIIFCLFGTSLGIKHDQYIGMEVISNFLKPQKLIILKIIAYIATLVALIILIFPSYDFISIMKLEKKILIPLIPTWYFSTIILIGFIFITISVIIRLVELISLYRNNTND